VNSTAVLGVNILRDAAAELRDIVGGRSKAYEKELNKGAEEVLCELRGAADALGANAVVGVRLDYEALGLRNSMLMVTPRARLLLLNRCDVIAGEEELESGTFLPSDPCAPLEPNLSYWGTLLPPLTYALPQEQGGRPVCADHILQP
jgi:uncharacterized protein YbjQ (UPF0145 family)